MSLLKIGIAALAAAVLVTGCDRAVTGFFHLTKTTAGMSSASAPLSDPRSIGSWMTT